MAELLVDFYRYECRACGYAFVRYAPDDAAPLHTDRDAPDQPCAGVGTPVYLLGHSREPIVYPPREAPGAGAAEAS